MIKSGISSSWNKFEDTKVKSMMTFSENYASGNAKGRGRKCNVCAKEGNMNTYCSSLFLAKFVKKYVKQQNYFKFIS